MLFWKASYKKIVMKKLLIFWFSLIFLLSVKYSFAFPLSWDIQKLILIKEVEGKIITREEWWANEEYRFLDSSYWQDILERNKKQSASMTEAEKKKAEEKLEKRKTIFNYLNKYFPSAMGVSDMVFEENGRPLARPIKRTNYVKSIMIHHTGSDYKDSYSWMQIIYRYHALSNGWGDIGYNFVIGYNGEIFEWRAWGMYVEWAHALWNNSATIGIAVMWNYAQKPISKEQYASLKILVQYLAYTYGINFYDTFPLHKECFGDNCRNGVISSEVYTLAGHRDGGYTSCPWEKLYYQLEELRKELQPETLTYSSIKNPWSEEKTLSQE